MSQSVRLTTFGAPLLIGTDAPPVPTGTQVVLRVRATGVCHTDLHLQSGGYDGGATGSIDMTARGLRLPLIPGHEMAGDVWAVGPDAQGAPDIGTACVVYPWLGCGGCDICLGGDEQLCPDNRSLGVFRDGGFTSHALLPHPHCLVPIGDLDPVRAAPLACAGLTAYGAVRKLDKARLDRGVAVIGAGAVGLYAMGLLRRLDKGPVLSCDIDPGKGAAALAAGADHHLSSDALAVEAAGGRRLGAVIDTVVNPATFALAFDILAKGGVYVAIGLFGGSAQFALPLLALRSLSLIGSYTGRRDDLVALVDIARRDPSFGIPSETRHLSRVNESLAALARGDVSGRIILEPRDD
jgi:D-arabinose 1-dehydrogenase-like Zn-dependent alcohol dehydrogenase